MHRFMMFSTKTIFNCTFSTKQCSIFKIRSSIQRSLSLKKSWYSWSRCTNSFIEIVNTKMQKNSKTLIETSIIISETKQSYALIRTKQSWLSKRSNITITAKNHITSTTNVKNDILTWQFKMINEITSENVFETKIKHNSYLNLTKTRTF